MAQIEKRYEDALFKKDIEELKKLFLEKLVEDEMNELTVIVPVEGEMFTYGMTFVPGNLVVMTWEIVMEYNHYDRCIKCNPELYCVQSKEEAFDKFVELLENNEAFFNLEDDDLFEIKNGVLTGIYYNMASIDIPKSVKVIGKGAFKNDNCLVSVNIPNSVIKIGDEVFTDCTALESIEIPDSVETIGKRVFRNTGIRDLQHKACFIKDGLCIKNGVLEYCSDYSMETIEIPDSVKRILPGAFSGCSSIKSVCIPPKIKKIFTRTFKGCTSLASIEIPNSVTTIECGAFEGCTALTSIEIPDSTEIGENAIPEGCTVIRTHKQS